MSTLGNFIADFKPWTDGVGHVQPPHKDDPTRIGGSQNGNRYLGDKIGEYDAQFPTERSQEIEEAARNTMAGMEPHFGILNRTVDNRGGINGIDDHVAALHIDAVVGTNYASRFLARANLKPIGSDPRKEKIWKAAANAVLPELAQFRLFRFLNYGHHNNQAIGYWHWSSWMGKFVHVTAAAQFIEARRGHGDPPPYWKKLWWCGALTQAMLTPRGKNQDAWVNSWHLLECGHDGSDLCSNYEDRWRRKLAKVYPDGIGGALQSYYRGRTEHPTVKWGKDVGTKLKGKACR